MSLSSQTWTSIILATALVGGIFGSGSMHTGPHGIGQKASDLDALPGCPTCHRELHQIGPVAFQEKHRIDFANLRAMFQSFYQSKVKGRAA
jgi:hypothetical protein